jgi:hypothetical protein
MTSACGYAAPNRHEENRASIRGSSGEGGSERAYMHVHGVAEMIQRPFSGEGNDAGTKEGRVKFSCSTPWTSMGKGTGFARARLARVAAEACGTRNDWVICMAGSTGDARAHVVSRSIRKDEESRLRRLWKGMSPPPGSDSRCEAPGEGVSEEEGVGSIEPRVMTGVE